jgi:zinc protease
MRAYRLPALLALGFMVLYGCQAEVAPSEEASLPAGVSLLETTERNGDELIIPYRKFRLDNGLTVILHEDRSDPIVHVDVTYHVGSAREEIGKSGFAHFFEHMMFQGSENVGDEQHFKIVTESGGTMNGSTSSDRTNYFQTVPSNQLEKMLWLEADRMGFLLDAVTQEKFEIQRDTVKNERAQRYENQPYGLLSERVGEALYPAGHPYSWQPIGYVEDLDRVDVNDLKEFFLRWYGPNNAVLTIGGRFDEVQTLKWIVKYFGPIPPGPVVEDPEVPVFSLPADRYISMEDNVALPLVYLAAPTVHAHHEDEAALDVLVSILGQGETSLLYKNLVKNGLAVQAGGAHMCRELACTFSLYAVANPAAGKTLADLEGIILEAFDEFETRGVLDDDLARVKMSIVAGKIYGLESVAGKVSNLAYYETFLGNPNYTPRDVARYEAVTKDDVLRVYERYIKGQRAVIMSIVPHGQMALAAAEDNWTMPERQLPEYETVAESDLEFRRASDTFDRSVMPPAGENPSLTVPETWEDRLENGIRVLGAVSSETPTVAIRLKIEAGQQHEPLDKLGLAALTAAMLNESTTESSNEEISNRLRKLGASVRFGAGDDESSMVVRSLTKNLDATLAIAAEMLFQPKFDLADFERLKSQTLQSIEHNKKEASVTAANAYKVLLFGESNAFAHPDVGTAETVAGISLDDVKGFYEAHYSPAIASIVAVSDLDQSELMSKLSVFADWEGPEVPVASFEPFPDTGDTRIYLMDKPGAAQSEIRIGKRALPFDATGEYYRAGVMNFVLGGAFNSRINLNLREDKGYTYGARSYFSGNSDYGTFTAYAGVRADATADSIVQFEKEIRGYAETGITEEELAFTRRALGQRDAREYETPVQKLGFIARILEYDLDPSFVSAQNDILAEIGPAEINRLAAKHLDVDEMIIVVVGDKQLVRPELENLGYEIVELE